MTVYINAAGLSSLLAGVGYDFPENGIVVALGIFGFLIAGVLAAFLGDKMERKRWLPIAAVFTFVGGVFVAFGVNDFDIAVTGAFLIFFGMDFGFRSPILGLLRVFRRVQEQQASQWRTDLAT